MVKSLVSWKRKVDKHRDETDGDCGVRAPKLTDTMQYPEFIMRDETNGEAMSKLGIKQWGSNKVQW